MWTRLKEKRMATMIQVTTMIVNVMEVRGGPTEGLIGDLAKGPTVVCRELTSRSASSEEN
jgi:hypothetical protein